MYVLLPSHSTRLISRRSGLARTLLHDPKATLPACRRARRRSFVVAPTENPEPLRGVVGIECAEVGEQVAKRPARVGGYGGRVDEADRAFGRRNVGEEGRVVLDGGGCCLSSRGTHEEKGTGRGVKLGSDGGELKRMGLRWYMQGLEWDDRITMWYAMSRSP